MSQRELIVDFYVRVGQNSAATVEAVALAEGGTVAHWPEDRRHPTLHELLVHMVAETNRHAGHADIVREMVDGRAGMRTGGDNLPGAASHPDKFLLPRPSDMRYPLVCVQLNAIDVDELRELLVDAWRMCVPKSVAAAFEG